MNSGPRWLISITDMPVPRQSSISSPARARTSAGSMAGPALKLKMRDIQSLSVNRGCRSRRLGLDIAVGCSAAVAALGTVPVAIAVAVDVALLDALEAGELLALVERDQRDALRRAAGLADLRHRGADEHAPGRYQHHLVILLDQHRADHGAVPLGGLDRDHALAAAAVARVLGDRRAFAVAFLGRREHRARFVLRREHAHHPAAFGEAHAAHAGGLAAHRAHLAFLEAHALAVGGEEHHVVLAVGEGGADEVVALL